MNKVIVEAIIDALTKGGNKDLTFKIMKTDTNAFWKLKVVAKPGRVHLMPLVERVGMSIGRFYGEGLNVVKTRHTILFS